MIDEPIIEPIKNDFFLRLNSADDVSTALAAFYRQDTETTIEAETGEETTVNVGDPYLVQFAPSYAIDIVGTINRPTGVTLNDADGNAYAEMAAIDGYHVNIRIIGDEYRDTVEALDVTYGVTPVNPARVWL